MKKLLYTSVVALALVGTGCSSDYLELAPDVNPSPTLLMSSTENAEYAINGLGRLLSNQFLSTQGCSGEGGMFLWYGELAGHDMVMPRYNSTWYTYANFTRMLQSDQTMSAYGWIYNYKMISNANVIINNIDGAEGLEEDRQYLKAQALVFRANAYLWLVQSYSKRWVDSNNGTSRGVVLRKGDDPDDMECSTVAETFQFIYNDLDEAISLFEASGKDRPSAAEEKWRPNVDVAHAVYARAALVRNDWTNAYNHASAVVAKYPQMSTEEYYAGFNAPNKEWIWMLFCDATQTLSYYPYLAYAASNANTTVCRTYAPLISKQLADLIPSDDARINLYGIPEDYEVEKQYINTTTSPGEVKKGPLFEAYTTEGSKYYDRYDHSLAWTFRAYAVMKFQVASGVGNGDFVMYRGAEMLYTQAEALYELGRETEARNILINAVKPYQPNYSCTLTGTELRDEIRLYRRFDLLGEGHSWYDWKRWNLPMDRLSWDEGGSWPEVFAGNGYNNGSGGNYGTSDRNNWCIAIPDEEVNFNAYIKYPLEPSNWTKGYETN